MFSPSKYLYHNKCSIGVWWSSGKLYDDMLAFCSKYNTIVYIPVKFGCPVIISKWLVRQLHYSQLVGMNVQVRQVLVGGLQVASSH